MVAYEADFVAEGERIGWSVIVTGIARRLKTPEAIARYEPLLRPWTPGEMGHVLRIQLELVTGFSLRECVEGEPGAA